MKVSKERAAANRAAILEAAGRLFRERGFAGAGVAEIAQAAGLTHGGFYGHFASKDALAAEACGRAFEGELRRVASVEGDLGRYLDFYLSARHRDRKDAGCPMVAFGADIARQGDDVAARFADGLEDHVGAFAGLLPQSTGGPGARRRRALALIATLAGAVTLARATAGAAPALSDELLEAARAAIDAALAGKDA